MFFFFKQNTAYEMRISDWSSDVCSSDLNSGRRTEHTGRPALPPQYQRADAERDQSERGQHTEHLIDPAEQRALVRGNASTDDAIEHRPLIEIDALDDLPAGTIERQDRKSVV